MCTRHPRRVRRRSWPRRKKLRIGNGLDKVDMGPMARDGERDRYEG